MLLQQPQQQENENQQQQNIPAPQRSLSLEPLIWRPPPVSQASRKASLSSRTDLAGKQRSSSYAAQTELELRVCHLEITQTELQLTASHLEQDVNSHKSKHLKTYMEPGISRPSASTKEPEGGLFRHSVKFELDQNLCQEQVTSNPERLLPETDFRPALSRHVSLDTESVPCRPLLPQNSRTELDPSLSHLRNSLKELETFLRQSVPYPENRETPANHTKHRRISSCVRTPTKEPTIPSAEVWDTPSIPLGRIASLPPCSVSAHRSSDQEQSPDHLSWTSGFESQRIQDIKTTPERRQDRHPPLSRQAATARHESTFRERCRTVSPAPHSTKVPGGGRDMRSPARQSLIVAAPRVARLTAWQQEADQRPPRPLSLASDLASPTWRDGSPRRLDEMGRLPSAFFPERDTTNGWSLSPDQLQGGLVSEHCISESTIKFRTRYL
jgi:hypothetical protein